MNLFLAIIRRSSTPLTPAIWSRYEVARCCLGLDLQRYEYGSFGFMVGLTAAGSKPSFARWGSHIGVGIVRLDNRPEIASSLGCSDTRIGDMELVVRATATFGEAASTSLLGDFAFIVWDSQGQSAVLARDAFGVKKLYYTQDKDVISVSSRAELLSRNGAYDVKTLIQIAAACSRSPDRSAYAGVHAFPPGSTGRIQHGNLAFQQCWSAEQFEPQALSSKGKAECHEHFRALFQDAVRVRLTGAFDVWSQLSGGLDSSSVASMAQWLARKEIVSCGLAGTVSWVYRWSRDGDEREYSGAVADQFGLRNEQIEVVFWDDSDEPAPLTDEPDPEYAARAREQRTCRIVRQAGGNVLLTGFGSDQYLLGNMFFFADRVARRKVGGVARDLLHRAALARTSFWEITHQNVVLPLLPRRLRRWFVPLARVPPWILATAARKYGLAQTADADVYNGRPGFKYSGYQLENVKSIPLGLHRHSVLEEELDVRHPFLYRPLVEFGLSLPPEMVVQPHARKWILREAMRGILPEAVRTRVGKGGNTGCTVRSLMQQRPKLESMLSDSLLGDLGCIDVKKLRVAYHLACHREAEHLIYGVAWTLAVESWLRAREGQSTTPRTERRIL